MLRSYLCDYSDGYIVVKRAILLKTLMMLRKEMKTSKIMLHLDHAYQRLIADS